MRIYPTIALVVFCSWVAFPAHGQRHSPGPQQEVHYTIDVELDTKSHLLTGSEEIIYVNHTADTLREVYVNLYVNAFRRNSAMELYQMERYKAYGGSIISYLRDRYLGYQEISDVRDDAGVDLVYEYDDTLVRILLAKPLPPRGRETLRFHFELKIPWLIRRMGWNNREGIEFTMAQWYPKVCVYDAKGWHKEYYVGREFYGEFGTFDVSITLPSDYVVGATGTLVNAADIGDMMKKNPVDTRLDSSTDGIQSADSSMTGPWDLDRALAGLAQIMRDTAEATSLRTWRYHAENVHDFAWCADPDFLWETVDCDGVRLNLLFQPDVADKWTMMKTWSCVLMAYLRQNVGPYAYRDFTIAQAGDGGMEYPGIVFITGHRGRFGLASVTAHEMAHNWFYGMLANDESMEAWLDEGITSYYTTRLMEHLSGRYAMREYDSPFKSKWYPKEDARVATYTSYEWWARQGYEEKVLTDADLFASDKAYQMAAYYKGQIFMFQLQYFFGADRLDDLMRRYFETWSLHHVSTEDFKRFLEKETPCELDWLFESWLNTTFHCDYAIGDIDGKWSAENGRRYYDASITLERRGRIAMPLDVYVKLKNDSMRAFRIPAHSDDPDIEGLERRPLWSPGVSKYELLLELDAEIEWVQIDTSLLLCDLNRMNNRSGLLPKIEWKPQRPVSQFPTLDTYVFEHRPSFWFNQPDGLRLGYRMKGRWATEDHRIIAGVYTGTRSPKPDYEVTYSTPWYGLGRQTLFSVQSYRLEGRLQNSLSLMKRYYSKTWDNPPVNELTLRFRNAGVFDSAYIPPGQSWQKGAIHTVGFSWRMQSRSFESPVLLVSIESALFGKAWNFSKAELSYKFPWTLKRKISTLWIRSTLGYAMGRVPDQDRFYVAGASPREAFENRFYRSRGTVPASAWSHEGHRYFYYDGGGSMAGYFDANPSGRRMAAVNLNLDVANPLKWIFKIESRWMTFWEPFFFYDAGMVWDRDSELKSIRKKSLMDAGTGARWPMIFIPVWMGGYTLRFDIPLWVSKPSINGEKKAWAWKWTFGLDREW